MNKRRVTYCSSQSDIKIQVSIKLGAIFHCEGHDVNAVGRVNRVVGRQPYDVVVAEIVPVVDR